MSEGSVKKGDSRKVLPRVLPTVAANFCSGPNMGKKWCEQFVGNNERDDEQTKQQRLSVADAATKRQHLERTKKLIEEEDSKEYKDDEKVDEEEILEDDDEDDEDSAGNPNDMDDVHVVIESSKGGRRHQLSNEKEHERSYGHVNQEVNDEGGATCRDQVPASVKDGNYETPSTISRSVVSTSKENNAGGGVIDWIGVGGLNMDLAKAAIKHRKETVKGFVKETLFRKVKFIVCDKQMDWQFPNFAKPILDHMGAIGDDKRERLWNECKSDAHKALLEKRFTVTGAVKKAVISK